MRGILTLILVLLVFSSPAVAGDWNHEVGLYGWFSGLKGTIGVATAIEEPVDATFDDLAGYVDFAMAGHYEAQNPSSLFIADISYTNLGAERDAQVANQPIKVNTDLTQWIIELGGGWRVSTEFSILMVGRYYNMDTGATFTAENGDSAGSVSTGWADIYLGARWAKRLGSKWTVSLRADAGIGGSDFAWFAQALVGFDISSRFTLAAAWRTLSLDREADVDTANYFKYDMTQSGLGLGLAYGF